MIYVIDYNDEIIETLDTNEDYILSADMSWNADTLESTFTFQILNKYSTNIQKRVRVLARDNKDRLREFIVLQIEQTLDGVTEVSCVASYLEDLLTAKPLKPTTLSQQTTSQSLSYFLADTGIQISDSNEYGGVKTITWSGWADRLSNAKMLQTAYDMRLDFYVEVDKHKVSGRYGRLISKKYLNVSTLEDDNPNFKGGEIVYGENMINLKRTIDHTEVRTALIALGPENSETGERIIIDFKDDEAQSQFGLPGRYLYDLYEPESSDENMTESRLRTLAKTHLNKLNKSAISYEVDSLSLYADVGDMIRVKNEDFTPELYVDAEIIAIEYDLISEVEKYQFGVINEYDRSQVMKNVQKILDEVRERIKNSDANIDQIIRDYEELENVYEPKIVKGSTPPESPRIGDLWLDTTDPDVAILKRYENGKWVKSSVSNVKEIGGMTREETMYIALKERLARNDVAYFEAFDRYGALVSEEHYHYVSDVVKSDLRNKYNALQQSYDDFKNSFNRINAEQPIISLLTSSISEAVKFEAKLKEFNDAYYVARKEFDEVIALLQSQYSDERYNELLNEVADSVGGIVKDDGSIDMSEELKRRNDEVLNMIADAIGGSIDENGNIDTNEVDRQRLEEAMKIVANAIGGTWNGSQLIADIPNRQELNDLNTSIKQYLNGEISTLDENLGKQIETVVNQAKDEFSVTIDSVEKKVDGIENEVTDINTTVSKNSSSIGVLENQISLKANSTEVTQQLNDALKPIKSNVQTNQAELKVQAGLIASKVDSSTYKTDKDGIIKDIETNSSAIEQTSKSLTSNISSVNKRIDDNKKVIDTNKSSITQLNKQIALKVTSEQVKETLNEELKVVKTDIGLNKAELLLLDNKISSKVESTEYTKDKEGIVSDIATTKSEVEQLSNSFTVKIDSVNKKVDGIENKVTTIDKTVTKNSSSISVLEKDIKLKVDNTTVEKKLTDALAPIQTNVQQNTAELGVQANEISQKVSSTKYTTDQNNTVKRFEKNEGDITTLQNEIKLKVTETDVQNKIDELQIGGRNLLKLDSISVWNSGVTRNGYEFTIKTNHSAGLRIDKDIFEPKNNYVLSYKIKVLNGLVYRLGGHSTGKTQLKIVLDNEEITGSHSSGVAVELSEGWHTFEFHFYYLGNVVDHLYIQPNRASYLESYEAIIKDIQLEKGSKATDWTPAPEDMEDRVKKAEGSITVNSDAISQKVSYTEINKTNKTLERVISELIVDVRGISYQYDVNGMISGFTLNSNYFKLNHNLIDINNGDVVIKNGTTTIKQAVINNGHISELSFDKLKGGTATFGGPDQNGTFEVLDVNGNAIMKADYEQATVSELSMGTIKAENVISDSVVEVMRLPREYIVNKTKYGYLEEAVTLSEVNPNIAYGSTREREISGSTTQSLTHTFNEISINETLTAGETYTVSFDISNVVGPNSGFIDLRPYEADNGSITVDIRSGRVEATWTQKVDSTRFLIYRDVVGKSRYDISFTISNVKIENGDTATTYVEQITDKESSDTVEVWYAGSIQQAVDSIPTYINDYVHIFIDTITDDNKVVLEGHVGNGWIRFYYNIKKNYNSFYFSNKIRVDIFGGGGANTTYNTGLFPYEGPVIEYHKNDYSLIRNLNLHGDGGPLNAVNVREGSSLVIRDCNFYNVDYGLYVTENSVATAINVAGNAEKYGWHVNWGSAIRGSGTVRPMGKLGSRRLSNGGLDETNFTVEQPPKVTNPPKVVVPKRITKKWTTTSARHFYRSSPTNFTVTFMRDYPIQGRWNDNWGYRDGAWFFGTSMRNTLRKKKIIKIRVSVGRSSANSQGYTGSRKFTLRMHKMANKPASNKNPTVSYGSATFSGNLAFGERKWFDVTSAFKSEIASGTFYGFGVRASTSSYYEYMALAKSLTVEVTYEE